MTQTPKRKLKVGDPVMLPSGLVTELTDIQYEHNRYQLLEAASGWQYGIDNLQPADWQTEARKWRREALRKYPTPEAYEAACAARDKHQARANAAEAREQRLKEAVEELLPEMLPTTRVLLKQAIAALYPDTPAPKEGADTEWINEDTCARCGRNKPIKGYEWCSECRPELKIEEGDNQ